MLIQSCFLHTFWFLGLFFHMALTSLKFDHISFWVHLYTKFANSLTYSFHIGLDPRSIQCSDSWTLSCIIQCIFEGSSQVFVPNSRHHQTSTLSLRESVEDISLLWVTMCNGTRGPIHGISHTKFKQFIIYTWKEYKK